MRNFHIAVAAALVMSAVSAQGQTKHSYVLVDLGDKSVMFADWASQTISGETTSLWVLSVGDRASAKIDHTLLTMEVMCRTRQMKTSYFASYLPDGSIFSSGATGSGFSPVIPGSVGETITDLVCNKVDPFPDTQALDGTDEAIAAGHRALAVMNAPPDSKSKNGSPKSSVPKSVLPSVSGRKSLSGI